MSLFRHFSAAVAVVVVLVIFLPQSTHAQERSAFAAESMLKVDGTSNQSDWSVAADSLGGWMEFSTDSDGVPFIQSVKLSVVVEEMSGGKGSIMDRLMLRTLKASEHGEITYELLEAETNRVEGAAPDSFIIGTIGNLTIAGETHQIEMIVGVSMSEQGSIIFSGSHEMKMSDFGLKPPTALFGALHTKDDIVIFFEMVVKRD